MINIYDSTGNVMLSPLTGSDAERVEELMSQDYAQLAWQSDSGTTLPAGSYIMLGGEKLTLLDPYEPEQKDEAEWSYRPKFQSRVMGWGKVPFFHYTYGTDNVITAREPDWTLTDTPANFMASVCKAIKNETGETWTYEIAGDIIATTITLSFSSADILSGLGQIAGGYDTEWRADKSTNTLYLGKAQHGTVVTLQVDANVGVPSVTRNKEGYYNRFYIFGSTRNITQDYQGANVNGLVNKRLTLDPAVYPGGYIDIPRASGTPVFPKILTFDDIYPHSGLTVADLRPRLMYRLDTDGNKVQVGTDSSGNAVYDMYTIWYFQLPGFTLNDSTYSKDNPTGMLISGKALSVHFKSGALTGREFELIYHPKAKNLHNSDGQDFYVKAGDYEIKFIEENGLIIPMQTGIVPATGDEVILFNIRMPQEYVATAYTELKEAALKEISDRYTSDLNNYTIKSNPVAFADSDPGLSIGQKVLYVNGDYSYETRVIKLVRKLDIPSEQEITIGSEKVKGNSETLKEEVVNANSNIDILTQLNQLTQNVVQAYQRTQQLMLDGLGKLGRMWEFDPDDPNVIYTKYNFYGKGWGSVLGKNPNAGTITAGATTLGGLNNVTELADSATAADKVLIRRAGEAQWTLANLSDIVGLDTTALATYLSNNHYAKISDIPSLADYLKKTEAASLYQPAGDYATNSALTSAINTLNTAIGAKLDASVFDDLFVKESDGKGGYRIKAKYALYSNQYISCLGANPDAGAVALGATTLGGLNNVVAAADEVSAAAKVLVREAGAASWSLKNLSDIVGLDTAALSTYLSNNHYATQQWVRLQGYLTEHQSLADYAKKTWVQAQGYLTAITKAQVEAVLTGDITTHTHSQYLTSTLASQTYQPIGDYATNSALNSAVSSLNTAIGKKLDAATFDDLFVKESDGNGGYRIRAKYAFYSNQYISCLGNNPGAGTTTGGGVDLDAVQEYLQQQGYATQDWVQQQGYVTALGTSGNYLTWTKNGTVNNITVPFASKTRHLEEAYGLARGSYDSLVELPKDLPAGVSVRFKNGTGSASSFSWATVLSVSAFSGATTTGAGYRTQLLFSNSTNQTDGSFWVRSGGDSTWGSWQKVLTAGNYTSVLNNTYVTLDTEQTITGQKTFSYYTRIEKALMFKDGAATTGIYLVPGASGELAFYTHSNYSYSGRIGQISYAGALTMNSFVKAGGTSSQILLADGSVLDESGFFRSFRGGIPTAYIDLSDYNAGASGYANYPSGTYTVGRGGYSELFVNFMSTTGSTSALQFLTSYPDTAQLLFRKTIDSNRVTPWRAILTELNIGSYALTPSNYTSTLDSRYVRSSATRELLWEWGNTTPTHVWGAKGGDASKAYVFSGENIRNFANAVCRAGDTMTGVLNIAHNSTNNVIKTQYNTAGDYTNVIFATVDNSRVIFGSPAWATVELETAGAAVWRRTAGTTYKIWDAGNDGSGSGLDADLLDGCHETSFVRSWWTASPGYNCATYNTRPLISFTYGNNAPFTGAFIDIVTGGYGFMLGTVYNSDAPLYYRRHGISRDGGLGAWQQLARIGDNVASATRLQGTYSLWGQSFYGNNVSGNMSGVGTINSAAAPINTIYASDWYRSIGATGWYNQTYGGGWHMDNASWIKSWNKPVYIAYAAGEGPNSFGVGLRCYHASHTSVEVQGGSYTMGLGCHNNGSWYWWRGTSSSKYYVMQYDGTTWNFTGVLKTSTGMYSDGYMSCLGKNDGSDERLKSIIEDVTLPIDVILAAPAKRFAWNANAGAVMAGKVAVGTLAQYWLEHLTEVVGTMPTGYYGVNYGALDWVAIHSVARYAYDGLTEHERRILALETENKALKSKINELERRVAA